MLKDNYIIMSNNSNNINKIVNTIGNNVNNAVNNVNNVVNNAVNNVNNVVNNVNNAINNTINNISNNGLIKNYSNLHVVVIFLGVLIVLWVLVYTYNKIKESRKKEKKLAEIKPAMCPDYWESLGNNRCKNVHHIGKCNLGDVGSNVAEFKSDIFTNKNIGDTSKCQWSKECESPWEGISNLC